MGEKSTEIIQLIPQEVVTEFVKGVKKSSYKIGFGDGMLCGFGAGLLLTAGSLLIIGAGYVCYDVMTSTKGEKNGSKSASGEQ